MSEQSRIKLRIIAGRWRGRRFTFPAIKNLRPTPDSVRETLFNWLGNAVIDANCLDLFAGSGALGLEALSRGAASAVFVDQSRIVVKHIKQLLHDLRSQNGHVINSQLPKITWQGKPFELVFLDPPFEQGLITPCCQTLVENQLLTPCALVYIESEKTLEHTGVPTEWKLLKDKTQGVVRSRLYQVK